jgi:proteasome lid subunit RPN8/RPN11
MDFNNFLAKLLGNDKLKFSESQIHYELIEEITVLANQSHPHEFVALFEGEIDNKVLKIEKLVFLPGETSNQGATLNTLMLPPNMKILGSVHSHPGPSNHPSTADLHFFSKMGLIHMIISEPYDITNIATYNSFGERIYCKVIY